jgi:hypothetical protein
MTERPHSTSVPNYHLLSEEILTLAQAARRLPPVRGKNPPCSETVFRWSDKGLLPRSKRGSKRSSSKSGGRVRLETIPVGGTTCTSMEALIRFSERLDDVEKEPPRLTPKQREAVTKTRAERAMEILRQRGRI